MEVCMADGKVNRKAERARERLRERKAKGLCTKCGKNPAITAYCEPCKTAHDRWRAEHRQARKDAGMCVLCGNPSVSNGVSCAKCSERGTMAKQKCRRHKRASGTCLECSDPALTGRTRCKRCSLKHIVSPITNAYDELEDKLHAQGHRCPYSGVALAIGENASIDHIVPRSKGGTHDLDNLQWVHTWVNMLKSDSSSDEFQERFDEFLMASIRYRYNIDLKNR